MVLAAAGLIMSETEPAPSKTFHVKVENYIDPITLKKDLSFSLADLGDAMVNQASMFAYYGTLAAKASRQVDNLKATLEIVEAAVYRSVRDACVKEGTKVTETMIDKSVSVHPRVRAIKRALNEARQIESNAKTAVEAFRHRRDMLVQQGLISREEMKGDVSIARRQAAEEDSVARRERVMAHMRAFNSAE